MKALLPKCEISFSFQKQLSSNSSLLSNNSPFGGESYGRSYHEGVARVICLLTTDRHFLLIVPCLKGRL